MRARYYDPLNGRFNQVDPYAGNNEDPQSLHKYLYCHANPVNGIDPSGLEFSFTGLMVSMSIGAVIGAIIGGVIGGVVGGVKGVIVGITIGAALGAIIGALLGLVPAINLAALNLWTTTVSAIYRMVYAFVAMLQYLWYQLRNLVEFSRSYFNECLNNTRQLLLGRFPPDALRDFGTRNGLLDPRVLDGNLGVGPKLVESVQQIIMRAPEVFIRAKDALQPGCFTRVNEIEFIAKNPELWSRTYVILENGTRVGFEVWAKANGILH